MPRKGPSAKLRKVPFVGPAYFLGHFLSVCSIEVDRAKHEVIEQLSPPVNAKGSRSFPGHTGFYPRFIDNFPHITSLAKDVSFIFNNECLEAFYILKKTLISASIS